MASGRRKRIMIACVTFETVKVTEPIDFYDINKAHIIHYVKEGIGERNRRYTAFYDRVVELISQMPRPVEIVEHNARVSDFSTMLRTILSIIQSERSAEPDCEVYVNISSGTSEYAAASAIAAMMIPGTTPFSVGTREYTVSDDKIEELYFIGGKPVGLTKSTFEPRSVPSYAINIPDEHLVRALRMLHDRDAAKQQITSGKMIEALKGIGVWYRDTDGIEPSSKRRQTEAVYYQRDFVAKWLAQGWVRKDELRNKYVVTDQGRNIIDTFHLEKQV